MPILSHIHVGKFCDENQVLLMSRNFVDQNQHINIQSENVKDQKNLVNELLTNEKKNKKEIEEIYKKEKNKSENAIQLMTAALIFLGAGLALAPFFIASTIILPILPFLLFGLAIISITKFIFNLKDTSLEVDLNNAINFHKELEDTSSDIKQKIIEDSSNELQVMKKDILGQNSITNEKMVEIEEKMTQILGKVGLFPSSPIPIPINPANESFNEETESYSHTK